MNDESEGGGDESINESSQENEKSRDKNTAKLPSILAEYFSVVPRQNDDNTKVVKAMCNRCEKIYKGNAGVTSNFIKHLEVNIIYFVFK